MNAQITQLIQDCDECQALRPSLHDNSQSHPPAVEPMHSVGLDLFECNGHHYLVMIDRFSNYIWVKRLTRLGTDSILKTLDTWFTEYGYPFIIVSDNGPQFRSDFKVYCDANFIIHSPSSPYNPRSNGLAEGAVKAAKHLLIKSSTYEAFETSLFAWRNTPTSGETCLLYTSPSPRDKRQSRMPSSA